MTSNAFERSNSSSKVKIQFVPYSSTKPQLPRNSPSFASDLISTLKITNHSLKYQLKHGQQFKQMLEPRDQVLEHEFNFQLNVSRKDVESKVFTETKIYQQILEKLKTFMVETISNVISISFKFLCRGELEQKQAKQYASKNIMLNVHSIYRQTVKAIEEDKCLKDMVQVDELKDNLIIQLDNILNNILINLADSYPQAPPSGSTPRMRQVITLVDRSDDDKNDFIFANSIPISDYLSFKKEVDQRGNQVDVADLQSGADYTQFIMRVINAAIEVAQNSKQDARERTIFELFTTFNHHLFWVTQEKEYQQVLSSLDQNILSEFQLKRREKKMNIDNITQLFSSIFDSFQPETVESINENEKLNSLWESAREGIENIKGKKQFAMGQKIPASVKIFTRQEIQNKQFSAKHSSILRILTKWAEVLEETFENPQKLIKERVYPFTSIKNEECYLKVGNKDAGYKLSRQLQYEYWQLKKKFKTLLKNSYNFIGKLLSNEKQSFVSSVSRYTQTRTVSSKINAVLTSLMLDYTNLLIHHLLRAGRSIMTNKGEQDLNLIHFRVYDLIRSKFQCNQNTFISVLKTMYLLDTSQSMQKKFKIIKIRDKMDTPSNNIIINYFFMGKVQCQLQLSIQETKGKEKNYYTFSHFVYELTRGNFGSIAECAIMISQLDPMITASRGGYYQEKKDKLNLLRQKEDLRSTKTLKAEGLLRQSAMRDLNSDSFFQCSICNSLITNYNLSEFLDDPQLQICYRCIVKKEDAQKYLKKELKQSIVKIMMQRLWCYKELKSLEGIKYLITIGSLGELSLNVVTYFPKEFKTFMIKVDSYTLNHIGQFKFDYNSLQFLDISDDIKKSLKRSKPPKSLSYILNSASQIPQIILDKIAISKDLLETKVGQLLEEFKQFMQQKNIIKTIKYKAEIIKANEEQGFVLDKVCRVLVLGEGKKVLNKVYDIFMGQQRQDGIHLKCNEIKHLNLSNLLKITSEKVGFTSMPKWVKECSNIKALDLDMNNISVIKKEELPSSLIELSLKRNSLEEIDVSGLQQLRLLFLKGNKLTKLDLTQNLKLQQLTTRDNQLGKFQFLPPLLQKITVDKNNIDGFDFKELNNLQYMMICNGTIEREELINIHYEATVRVKDKIKFDR